MGDANTICYVDATDSFVKCARERYPEVPTYRRDFDGNLPKIEGVIYSLPSRDGKYASVLDRVDVVVEEDRDIVYSI